MKIDQYCQRERCKHVELEQCLAWFRVTRGLSATAGLSCFSLTKLLQFHTKYHIISLVYLCQRPESRCVDIIGDKKCQRLLPPICCPYAILSCPSVPPHFQNWRGTCPCRLYGSGAYEPISCAQTAQSHKVQKAYRLIRYYKVVGNENCCQLLT